MYMVRLRQRETFKHGNQIFSRSLFMYAVTGSFSAKFSSNMKTCCQMLLCTSCLLHYCGNSAWEPRLSYWFKESTEDGDSGALQKKSPLRARLLRFLRDLERRVPPSPSALRRSTENAARRTLATSSSSFETHACQQRQRPSW